MAKRRPRARPRSVVSASGKARTSRAESEVETRTERAVIATPFRIDHPKQVGERWLNLLAYGEYGHGKTTFAGSAMDVPSMTDVLYVNAEAGDMSLSNRSAMDMVTITTYAEMARIAEFLQLHVRWRDEGRLDKILDYEKAFKGYDTPKDWFTEQREMTGKPMDEPYVYRTLIVDTLSEVQRYLVYQFVGIDLKTAVLDDEIEQMEEWQAAQEMMRLLVRQLRDLEMNVIFITPHDLEKERGKSFFQPKLPGKLAGDVVGFMDVVGYLRKTKSKEGSSDIYRMYLGAGYDGFLSKHRFTNLPDLGYIDNPSMAKLIELGRKDTNARSTKRRIQSEAEGEGEGTGKAYGRRETSKSTGAQGRKAQATRARAGGTRRRRRA